MSLFVRRRRFTYACTVLSAGIGITILKDELTKWMNRIKATGATRAWIFHNDYDANAPQNGPYGEYQTVALELHLA
jgi:hypothetical protein